jgi:hypothetical protein
MAMTTRAMIFSMVIGLLVKSAACGSRLKTAAGGGSGRSGSAPVPTLKCGLRGLRVNPDNVPGG